MHSSEGMYYSDKIQSAKYPVQLVKKIKNISLGKKWCEISLKRGRKTKLLIRLLKFDKRNYKKFSNKRLLELEFQLILELFLALVDQS